MTLTEAEDVGSRVRTARLARGMSLRALAKKVGVSASMLSLLETGRSRSSVSTLYAIVEALGMSMVDLFDNPEPETRASSGDLAGSRDSAAAVNRAGSPDRARSVDGSGSVLKAAPMHNAAPAGGASRRADPRLDAGHDAGLDSGHYAGFDSGHDAGSDPEIAIVRRDRGRRIEMESGVVWEQLGHFAGDSTEFLLVTYPPGAKSSVSGRFQRHTDHEHGYIVEGDLTCQVGFREFTLNAGDSVVFDSSRPHLLENRGETDVRAIWFIVRTKPRTGP